MALCSLCACSLLFVTMATWVSASGAALVEVSIGGCHLEENQCKLDDALGLVQNEASSIRECIQASPIRISLYPGEHFVSQFQLISNIRGAQFIGMPNKTHSVSVRCASSVGFAFLQVSELHLENITIENCGMKGLKDTLIKLEETLNLFFFYPENITVAVFIGASKNVTLEQVTITNTTGIGLLGINVVGTVVLENTVFSLNGPTECPEDFDETFSRETLSESVGGGAYFTYFDPYDINLTDYSMDTIVNISHSNFTNNSDCGVTGLVELFIDFSITLRKLSYVVGGGGGLCLMITQQQYPVVATITSSEFRNNMARMGGGAHIGLFNGVRNCRINIENCIFEHNGFEDASNTTLLLTQARGGAGLMIFTDLVKPSEVYVEKDQLSHPSGSSFNTSISISNSNFTKNIAFAGGGVFVYSLYYSSKHMSRSDVVHLQICHCKFKWNTAVLGAALYVYEKKFVGSDRGMDVVIENVEVRQNTVVFYNSKTIDSVLDSSAAVDFRFTNTRMEGVNDFTHNQGTALKASRALVNITGNVTFSNNHGVLGGAIQIYGYGVLLIRNNSNIWFVNNTATVKGGAIYANFRVDLTYQPDDNCFIYFVDIDALLCYSNTCPDINNLAVHLKFSGNKAPIGSIIYGSTLETCSWVQGLKKKNKDILHENWDFEYLHQLLPTTFDFGSVPPTGITQTSTPPALLKILNGTNTTTEVMPGESFNLSIEARDRFNQLVPGAITSAIICTDTTGHGEYIVKLGKSGYWFLDGGGASDMLTPMVVKGKQNEIIPIVIYTVDSFADEKLYIKLNTCSVGFIYNTTSLSCICDPRLNESQITCVNNSHFLQVPDHWWVGLIDNNTNLYVSKCVFDYCKKGRKDVDTSDFKSQCAEGYNRNGPVCSSCTAEYSVVLGTNRCLKCSNVHLSLIPAFGAAGVLLIFLVSFFQISLSEGYLNGILFYSNTVNLFIPDLVAPTHPISYVLTPIALLSLNLGIETCFYNGMTMMVRVFLTLLFPTYLFILMGVITLFAQVCNCKCFATFSAAKTFSTLLLLCYIRVLATCIESLAAVSIKSLDGNLSIRWVVDANQPYFQGWHAAIGILAIIILLFYIIPLPFILLFPTKAYQLKYLKKLKPIYDVIWAPFKPRYRFWLGFRLLFRAVPFTLACLHAFHPLHLFILVGLLSSLLYVQLVIRPFQGVARNLFDSSLILNNIFLVLGTLYFSNIINSNTDEKTRQVTLQHQSYYTFTFIKVAYLEFLAVFICHIVMRFSWLRRVKQFLLSKCPCYHETVSDGTDIQEYDRDEDSAQWIVGEMHSMRTNVTGAKQSELIAPLLEEKEGTLQLTPL